MNLILDIALLALMGVVAIAIIRLRDLVAVTMLASIYSLLAATMFVILDAADVAFTEAAVGAGISTVLMLAALNLTGFQEKIPARSAFLPGVIVIATGLVLGYGMMDLPRFGDPEAPIHLHVAPKYLQDTGPETGIPNVVTAVLASYRGYDTLGETTVIFTAGLGVTLLLSGRRRRKDKAPKPPAASS